MNTISKQYLAKLVSCVPSNGVRIWLYRTLFGYRIGRNCAVKPGVVIAVKSFRCGDRVVIGRGTEFVGPFEADIGDGVLIGKTCIFSCGHFLTDNFKPEMKYKRRLSVGSNALIHDKHYFDVYGAVEIGEGTWIAGRESQFWTHGASALDRDITIGSESYVGSAVRFAPGTAIGSRCIVGIGSVVTSKIEASNVIIAGVPAKAIRERAADDGYVFKRDW